MSTTVRIKDYDGVQQTYTVTNGVKLVDSAGTGFESFIQPTGSVSISANGTYDVTDKASAVVNVSGGGGNAALLGVLDGSITQLTAQDLAGLTHLKADMFRFYDYIAYVELPSSLLTIGNAAFSEKFGTPSLTTLIIPGSVSVLPYALCSGCSSLASVTLGEGIAQIGDSAFAACGFTSITIPSTVTQIDYQAFVYCTHLVDVTVLATTPPTLDTTDQYSLPFYLCNNLSAIYVLDASVAAYKAAPGWSDYSSIIQAKPT